jgi:hypothetical protein
MYRDSDSGEWNISAAEEKWAAERAREYAAEAFNLADPAEFDIWVEYNPSTLAQFVADVIKLEHLCPPLRPLLDKLRESFVDDSWVYYEEDAYIELEEARAYRESEDV